MSSQLVRARPVRCSEHGRVSRVRFRGHTGAGAARHQALPRPQAQSGAAHKWSRAMHAQSRAALGRAAPGATADEFYRRYPADIRLMRSLGIRHFRMSIAWPRVLPQGAGPVNPASLAFYLGLVEALQAAGIQPYVTLCAPGPRAPRRPTTTTAPASWLRARRRCCGAARVGAAGVCGPGGRAAGGWRGRGARGARARALRRRRQNALRRAAGTTGTCRRRCRTATAAGTAAASWTTLRSTQRRCLRPWGSASRTGPPSTVRGAAPRAPRAQRRNSPSHCRNAVNALQVEKANPGL